MESSNIKAIKQLFNELKSMNASKLLDNNLTSVIALDIIEYDAMLAGYAACAIGSSKIPIQDLPNLSNLKKKINVIAWNHDNDIVDYCKKYISILTKLNEALIKYARNYKN